MCDPDGNGDRDRGLRTRGRRDRQRKRCDTRVRIPCGVTGAKQATPDEKYSPGGFLHNKPLRDLPASARYPEPGHKGHLGKPVKQAVGDKSNQRGLRNRQHAQERSDKQPGDRRR